MGSNRIVKERSLRAPGAADWRTLAWMAAGVANYFWPPPRGRHCAGTLKAGRWTMVPAPSHVLAKSLAVRSFVTRAGVAK